MNKTFLLTSVKLVSFIIIFAILFVLSSNILDMFFDNRTLVFALSIVAFLVVLISSLIISKKISEWVEDLLKK